MKRAGTIIVGTGQAGFQTAASLRAEGYLEPITLIGEEPHIPYQRPPLSKGFLLGNQDADSIELRPAAFYSDHQIMLLAGERVRSIARGRRLVEIESGGQLSYESLVLATGASNRALPVGGAELEGVLYLRSFAEAILIKEHLESAQSVVVIGGGFIGLELAAVASQLGKNVTVVEALPRLMSRVVAPIISEFFREYHTSKGVRILCGKTVTQILNQAGKVRGVHLADGEEIPADLVLIGIGIIPNTELAAAAGLPVANGICVNEFLLTPDLGIFAIGDCAEYPNTFAGCRVRLESVQNAADQAQCVATAIAGRPAPYKALPWFWTDQFDIKLQMAGISAGHDRVVMRGRADARKFSVFYFRGEKLIAIDSINRPVDHMMGRKLIAAGAHVTPELAADENSDLKKLALGSELAPQTNPAS
ncbi:MAG TPA: FAD-dependent oxidoreductase [Candidatus Acidoferrum sp.]|nr:FAD-dependent oxidoreductase [Candidatus Acidoferrum sp.]